MTDALTIAELCRQRDVYDQQYSEHYEDPERFLRHTGLHYGKVIGKEATFLEQLDHGLNPSPDIFTQEIAPDLLAYGLQCANIIAIGGGLSLPRHIMDQTIRGMQSEQAEFLRNFSLDEMYHDLFTGGILWRHVIDRFVRYRTFSGYYEAPHQLPLQLFYGAVNIANMFNADLQELYLQRCEVTARKIEQMRRERQPKTRRRHLPTREETEILLRELSKKY